MVTDRETEAQRWSWIDTAGPGLWLHGTFPGMSTYASRWQVPRSHAAWQTRLGAISEVVCILQNPHLPGIGSGTRARIHALFIAYPVEKLRPDSQRASPRSSVSPGNRCSEIRWKERVALSLGAREQTPWVPPCPWQPGFSELMGQESNGC